MTTKNSIARSTAWVGAALLLMIAAQPAPAGEALTLRFNDVDAKPGGVVALVVRTYESRPLGQGQGCFNFNSFFADPSDFRTGAPAGALDPFEEYFGSIVFSRAGDARHRLTLGPGDDLQVLIEFMSPSGTINDSDGPMVVHYVRLSADAQPGDRYQLQLDPSDTWLIDDAGNPVPIEIRGGELTVRGPSAPLRVEAEAGEVRPGRYALVAFQTAEVLRLSEGEVTLLYETSIAADVPVVVIDPKIGGADFEVDNSVPGRTTVSFQSTDADFNRLPGDLIRFYIRTRADVPLGTRSPVRFDSSSTIFDRQGDLVPVVFEPDVIEFTND